MGTAVPPLGVRVFFEHFLVKNKLDLREKTVCFPVSRAGRRFIELVVTRAEKEGVLFTPPRICTVGAIPELLLQSLRPHAPVRIRLSAWLDGMRALSSREQELLFSSVSADTFDLIPLAEQIEGLYVELSGAGCQVEQVSKAALELGSERSAQRWQLIGKVIQSYRQIVYEQGYFDRYLERERALQSGSFAENGELFLAGVSDLNGFTKQLLERYCGELSVLLYAPESERSGFDEFGAIRSNYWIFKELPISLDRCHAVLGPGDQAAQAIQVLSKGDRANLVEDVTIGLVDDTLAPYLEQRFLDSGIELHSSAGRTLLESRPGKALQLVARYLESRSFRDFSNLVRYPDVERALCMSNASGSSESRRSKQHLTVLDKYQSQHFQAKIGDRLPGGKEERQQVSTLYTQVSALLGDLVSDDRPLSFWIEPTIEFLRCLFTGRTFYEHDFADRNVIDACRKFVGLISDYSERSSDSEKCSIGNLSGSQAIRMFLRAARSETVRPEPRENAVEMLGWLELPLDDAPVVVVTGCNEGLLPESINSDPFLPNSLRKQVGLVDNEHRFARDVYATATLLESRGEVHFLFGQSGVRGEQLLPSRLFFQTVKEKLPARALALYNASSSGRVEFTAGNGDSGAGAFSPPRPQNRSEPIAQMTVTSFRDYLRCPYRYYLKHIRHLRSVNDSVSELDAAAFGSLLHHVLAEFARSAVANSVEPREISGTLLTLLGKISKQAYGKEPLPAVLVQLEQVKHRLLAFAKWQATWRAKGWIIEQSEYVLHRSEVLLPHAHGEMKLVGRIDRIDRNEQTGDWMIFDYKTSDYALTPEGTHQDSAEGWVDLQLPLYEFSLRQLGFTGPIELGYVVLPREEGATGAELAAWEPEDLADAVRVASEVAGNVYEQRFWPPSHETLSFDDFARICGVDQYTQLLMEPEAS